VGADHSGSGVTLTVGAGAKDSQPDLRALHVRDGQGGLVSLEVFVQLRRVVGPAAVYREGGRRCLVVACNVQGRDTRVLGNAVRGLAKELSRPGVSIAVD